MHPQRSLFIKNINLPKHSLFMGELERVLASIDCLTGRRNRPSKSVIDKRRLAALYVIEGLYQGFCHINQLPLAVPHHPSAYSNKNNRLHRIGYVIFRSVCDTLEAMQWIERSMGHQLGNGQHNITTSLTPQGDLRECFIELGIRWQEMELHESVITLRNYDSKTRKKYPIPIPEEIDISKMKNNLQRINQFLNQQAIALCVKDSTLKEIAFQMTVSKKKRRYTYLKEINHPLTFTFDMVQLRRIFSRSSMELGGRFYGGWWQFIPKEYRPHITINGLATVEIDYSSLHPSMLYHLEGIAPPQGDLYDVGLWKSEDEKAAMRPLVKEFFNASINDQYGEFRLTQVETKLLKATNPKLLALIKEKHPVIAKYLASGFGLTLQYIDSQIAERVMLLLLKENIVCLPLHDSFIGPLHQRAAIVRAMAQAYQERFGVAIPLESKDLYETDDSGKEKYQKEFVVQWSTGGSLDLHASIQHLNNSIHSQYVQSHWRVKDRNRRERQTI